MVVRALECTTREPFEGYPYELVRGVAHFGADPDIPANGRITDLALTERDRSGEVAFHADFCLLRPLEIPDGGINLLFVVANRGLPGAIPFSLGTPWWDPTRKKIEPGDGFLLHRGWAVAWCGWQWDVLPSARSLALHAPEALDGGRPIPGRVRLDFTSPLPMADHLLCDSSPYFVFRTYPARHVEEGDATLTVRDTVDGSRQVIDRGRWRFARDEAGSPVADRERVWLEGGFEPHRFYEVIYTTDRSPVAGTGLLAVRDFLSHLRYHQGAANPLAGAVSHVFGYGASQSGRFLRHFVHEGLNRDESGRPVFDGVLSHVAGARLGEFNQRYGQPSHQPNSGTAVLPPFSPGGPAPTGGLFDRQTAQGQMPKVFLTNTSWEYWRGDASLNHIDPEGRADLPEEPDTRNYLLAGTDHLGPSPVKRLLPLANPANELESMVLLRALLADLVAWAVDGVEPPPSEVPRLADGTAVTPEAHLAAFPAIPEARRPEPVGIPRAWRVDLGPDAERGVVRLPAVIGEAYATFVAAPDADGHDAVGIRLPDLTVPVATYTGWNPRRPVPGLPDVLHDYCGSTFPLPREAAEREAAGDPRPSIAERYAGRDAYAGAVRAATRALVASRHLLADDEELVVNQALERYDAALRRSPALPTS